MFARPRRALAPPVSRNFLVAAGLNMSALVGAIASMICDIRKLARRASRGSSLESRAYCLSEFAHAK
jgi:hypothetical protein